MAELNAANLSLAVQANIDRAIDAIGKERTPRTILKHLKNAEEALSAYGQNLAKGDEFANYRDEIKQLYSLSIEPCIEDVVAELEADKPVESRTRAALRRADKAVQNADDMATPAQQAALKPLSEKWLNAHPKYAPLFENQAKISETIEAGEAISKEQVAENEQLYANYQTWVNKSRSAPTQDAKQLMEGTAQVRANLLEEHAKTWLEAQDPYQALAEYEERMREKVEGGQSLTDNDKECYNQLLDDYWSFAEEEAPGPVTQSLMEGKGADFYSNATELIGRDYQNGLGNDPELVQKDVSTPSESPAQEAGEQGQTAPATTATASPVQDAGLLDEQLSKYDRVLEFQQKWIDAAGVLLNRQAQTVSQMPQGHLKASLHAINQASMELKAEAEKHHVSSIRTAVREMDEAMSTSSPANTTRNVDHAGATAPPPLPGDLEITTTDEPIDVDVSAYQQGGEGSPTTDEVAASFSAEGVTAEEPQAEGAEPPSPPENTPAQPSTSDRTR